MFEVKKKDPERLRDGDVILILAAIRDDSPVYWELAFRNPAETVPASSLHAPAAASQSLAVELEYDREAWRIFRVRGHRREELANLPGQPHLMLRYMFDQNRRNGGIPVLCSHEDLMEAVWGQERGHTRIELNGVVHELRQRIELDPGQPRFLQNVRGLGYRLDPHPEP